jgi:dihydroorotate dehydrogenase
MTPADVFERLSLGANLVQVYSALIFDGPFFFRHVAELAAESRL